MKTAFDPETADIEEPPAFSPESAQPEKMVGGIFGKVSESDYASGERNVLGNIVDRPAAAIRSALMGKGYKSGAINPSAVPTFQDTWLDAYYKDGNPSAVKTLGGNLVSAAGLAADTLTDPSNALAGLATESMIVRKGLGTLAKTKAGQLVSNVVNAKVIPDFEGLNKFKQNTAGRVINSLIKPLMKDFAYGKDAGRGVAREGIVANSMDDLLVKIGDKKNIIGKEIGQKIAGVTSEADYSDALKPIDDAIDSLSKSPRTNAAAISRLNDTKKDLLQAIETPEGITYGRDLSKMNPTQAFEFKTQIADVTKWTGSASDDKAVNKALQQSYRNIKNKLNNDIPGLKDLNERYSDLLTAEQATKYRDMINERQNIISLNNRLGAISGAAGTFVATGGATGPSLVAGAMGAAVDKFAGSPFLKTRLAAWLAKPPDKQAVEILKNPEFGKSVQKFLTSTNQNAGILRKLMPDVPVTRKNIMPVVAGAAGLGGSMLGPKDSEGAENVDMNKIYSIESSNNPNAHNKSSNARGLGQVTPIVLKEWNNFHPKDTHTKDDLFNADTNKKISNWYMNKRIPSMLKSKKKPDTINNRLIAYNWGIGNVGKKTLPKETSDYIKKYAKR